MADLIPHGPNTVSGRDIQLGATDSLSDPTNSLLAGGTGLFGVSGLMGATGLTNPLQGVTGIAFQGNTGIIGQTGVIGLTGVDGLQASTGLRGITGLGSVGVTGIAGATGVQGMTGLHGLQGMTGVLGITGFFGVTGLFGETGLFGFTGVSVIGITGLVGSTGLQGNTGIVGATGIPMSGVSVQGITGIQGVTGLLELVTLDVQRQTTGVTLLYSLPANSLSVDGQHLEVYASGLSATDGTLTTLVLQLGGYQVFAGNIAFAGGADISLYGNIIRVGTSLQESSIQVIYEDGSGTVQWQSITADLTLAQNLIASLTSAGTGHILYSLVARKLSE